MGYVDNNLMPSDHVVYKAVIHWIIFLPGFVVLLIGVFLVVLGVDRPGFFILAAIAFVLAILMLLKAFIIKISTELAVTSKRVIAKMGFIRRYTVELNHSKVESVNVDQSVLGKLLDYGTLIMECRVYAHRDAMPCVRRSGHSWLEGGGSVLVTVTDESLLNT